MVCCLPSAGPTAVMTKDARLLRPVVARAYRKRPGMCVAKASLRSASRRQCSSAPVQQRKQHSESESRESKTAQRGADPFLSTMARFTKLAACMHQQSLVEPWTACSSQWPNLLTHPLCSALRKTRLHTADYIRRPASQKLCEAFPSAADTRQRPRPHLGDEPGQCALHSDIHLF